MTSNLDILGQGVLLTLKLGCLGLIYPLLSLVISGWYIRLRLRKRILFTLCLFAIIFIISITIKIDVFSIWWGIALAQTFYLLVSVFIACQSDKNCFSLYVKDYSPNEQKMLNYHHKVLSFERSFRNLLCGLIVFLFVGNLVFHINNNYHADTMTRVADENHKFTRAEKILNPVDTFNVLSKRIILNYDKSNPLPNLQYHDGKAVYLMSNSLEHKKPTGYYLVPAQASTIKPKFVKVNMLSRNQATRIYLVATQYNILVDLHTVTQLQIDERQHPYYVVTGTKPTGIANYSNYQNICAIVIDAVTGKIAVYSKSNKPQWLKLVEFPCAKQMMSKYFISQMNCHSDNDDIVRNVKQVIYHNRIYYYGICRFNDQTVCVDAQTGKVINITDSIVKNYNHD